MKQVEEISEEEWRTIARFAANPRLRLQGVLLYKMRRYFDSLSDSPRLKHCGCVLHDVAVWLTNKRRHDETKTKNGG